MNSLHNLSPAELKDELCEYAQESLCIQTGQAHPIPAQIAQQQLCSLRDLEDKTLAVEINEDAGCDWEEECDLEANGGFFF